MKFGGSSVGDAERIRNVAAIVKSKKGESPIVVVSAVGGTTDSLIDLAKEAGEHREYEKRLSEIAERHRKILRELKLDTKILDSELAKLQVSARTLFAEGQKPGSMDEILSFGERLSARIVAACISSLGVKAEAWDAYDIGLTTDSNFGNADVAISSYHKIRKNLSGKKRIPVITGFIGKDRSGNITTLGRGGSDYTACIIGAAVGAVEIEIWTNTNGVLTADPKIVAAARSIPTLMYGEELELEALGANTLHPKGILPAVKSNIPIKILNTMQPAQKGTLIKGSIDDERRVASITHKDDIRIIDVGVSSRSTDSLHRILDVLRRYKVSVDTVSTAKSNVMIILSGYYNKDIDRLLAELRNMGSVEVRASRAKVSVVGKDVSSIPGMAGRILSSVDGINVDAVAFGPSTNSQSFFVKEEDAYEAIRLLHKTFFGR